MASNPNLNELKILFSTYYNNFFFDNREIVGFLRDITATGGNFFDVMSKQILSLAINNNNQLILRKNRADTDLKTRYHSILFTLHSVIQTLVYIIRTTSNYHDIYRGIQKVQLINTAVPADIAPVLKTVHANLKTKYMIEAGTLYIYDSDVKAMEFDKFTHKYKEHLHDQAIDNDIIKNHIYFILSFNDYNMKSQIFAYYYYIITAKIFADFYYNAEYLLDSGSDESICNYFNNEGSSVMRELSLAMDALISSSGQTTVLKEFTAKCINMCPVSLKINYADDKPLDDLITFDKDSSIVDEFLVIIDEQRQDPVTKLTQTISTTYEIMNASYLNLQDTPYLGTAADRKFLKDMPPYMKIPDTIILKAYSTQATGCGIEAASQFQTVNVELNQNVIIKIYPKSVSDMRRDYIMTGMNLGSLNSDIQRSKDKINRVAKNYNKQKDVNRFIEQRQTIYTYIIIALFIGFTVLYFVEFKTSLKLTTSYGMLVVVLIMLAVNYYLKYDFIEPFNVVTVDATPCSGLGESSSISSRLTFIQNNITSFSENVKNLVLSFHVYLSTLDSLDLFKKMTGSLKTEMRQFKEHEKYYRYKEKLDNKTVDVMKHEMITNTAYINMITFICLIITIFFICYFYRPELFKTYAIVAVILIGINMAVYYLIILKPVRTRARNKYWAKPTKKTLLSVD
jgi:hypothetical protein